MLAAMADEHFAEPTHERHALNAAIDLGTRARAFFDSALGRAIALRAESDRQSALEALVEVDPADTHAVAGAQRRVHAIDAALRWFAAQIEEGDAALFALAQHDDAPDEYEG